METLRIATRKSPLAMWQATFVKDELQRHHADLKIEIIGMTTKGDQILDISLAKIGGKGLFVKELEQALINKSADIAIHSMKDVGVSFPGGLGIGCIMKRHSPLDAFVSNHYQTLEQLPHGAVIGTCSLRRICQIKKHYPHLQFKDLRGNVGTRLGKLDKGEYDGIILAKAGLERLGLHQRIASDILPEICLPAIAQGSLGIEVRENDTQTLALLAPLEDAQNTYIATAERAVNARLNGSCQMPIAAYATSDNKTIYLRALIGSPDGKMILSTSAKDTIEKAHELGLRVADSLLEKGAQVILDSIEQ